MDSNESPPLDVGELISRYKGNRPLGAMRSLGVRVEVMDFARLEVVSKHLGVSKSTLARDLLSVGLRQALGAIASDPDKDPGDIAEELDDWAVHYATEED